MDYENEPSGLTHAEAAEEGTSGSNTSPREPWFAAERREALLELLRTLEGHGYDFVTATPGTHARVLKRRDRRQAKALRDVLGWSLPFTPDLIEPDLLELLQRAGAVSERPDGLLVPQLRVSGVEGTLFLHSAYPTTAHDSVFLGPDSYRFAQFILAQMQRSPGKIVDYGAGGGVGGIVAACAAGDTHLTIADINPKALFLASINAEHAGVRHSCVEVTAPRDLQGSFDLFVTHPPFMIDAEKRAYRDGGDLYGAQLSLDWVLQGAQLLTPGGQLILHTGVSIVDGRDVLLEALREQLPAIGYELSYRELDPDIFSEDLDQPGYQEVERIAAVGLALRRAADA